MRCVSDIFKDQAECGGQKAGSGCTGQNDAGDQGVQRAARDKPILWAVRDEIRQISGDEMSECKYCGKEARYNDICSNCAAKRKKARELAEIGQRIKEIIEKRSAQK